MMTDENARLEFEPDTINAPEPAAAMQGRVGADRRDGSLYVYPQKPDLKLAIRTAHATGRPLLMSGPSGVGKSSLAMNVALQLKYRYYEFVVTHRTEARDLLYRFDAVRKLNDATAGGGGGLVDEAYVTPNPLWWALAPKSAARRGFAPKKKLPFTAARDPNLGHEGERAVLLIDEIDKGDPDLPNALLVALGSQQFPIEPIDYEVRAETAPIIIITTNGERDLPATFVRRCVHAELEHPSESMLETIGLEAVEGAKKHTGLAKAMAKYVVAQRDSSDYPEGSKPSTAEYLDLLRACLAENVHQTEGAAFEAIARMTVKKSEVRR